MKIICTEKERNLFFHCDCPFHDNDDISCEDTCSECIEKNLNVEWEIID